MALLTAGAIFLASSTHPPERVPSTFAEAVEDDLDRRVHKFIDVAIWIGWCVEVFLIGFFLYSEFRYRPPGDHDAEAVQEIDPTDPDFRGWRRES